MEITQKDTPTKSVDFKSAEPSVAAFTDAGVIIKQNMMNMNALLYADFRYEVIVGLGVRFNS